MARLVSVFDRICSTSICDINKDTGDLRVLHDRERLQNFEGGVVDMDSGNAGTVHIRCTLSFFRESRGYVIPD